MTGPFSPEPSPRDGFQPVPGFNRRRGEEQKRNITRAIGALARRADRGDATIVQIYQSAVAGAIVAAEEASAARDAASPT